MKNKKLIITISLSLLIILFSCSTIQFNKVKAASNPIQNVTRIGGADRFETSVKIAKQGWNHSYNVVLADVQGDNSFADAVASTSLAYYLDCPILLTNINSTPDIVKDEISKLGVKNIYISGGTGVISKSQEDSFKSNGYNIIRIAGLDRFDTACKAADILNSKSKIKKAYIVPADKFQYSLIAAPYAAKENAAILFTSDSNINDTTKNELLKLGVNDVCIVGSYNIISYHAEAELESLGINCFRIHGTTPESVASSFINVNGNSNAGISIASAKMFPDALSSSVLTAKDNYSILLVDYGFKYTINSAIKKAFIFGGTGVVNSNLENYIKDKQESKEISNDEIYRLYSDSQVAVEDIMFSISNEKTCSEGIIGDDGKEYVSLTKQYNSSKKIKDVLSNYYTEKYVSTIANIFKISNINGKNSNSHWQCRGFIL